MFSQVQSDDEVIEDRTTTAAIASAVESNEEKEPDEAASAPEQLQATPKSQQQQPAAVPKLKTPLQPTKVTEFEDKEKQEQDTEINTDEVRSKPDAEQQPEMTSADSAPEVAVPEVVEAVPELEPQEAEMEGEEKEKPSPRYSQLSEDEERLRTYSEISETSDDRIKFVIGETESESGSHLDLKGKEYQHHSGQKAIMCWM